jgi:hypothetical protein
MRAYAASTVIDKQMLRINFTIETWPCKVGGGAYNVATR